LSSVKIPTIDAQSLAWSPDGRWLAVLDTPTATTSVHFYTPDGHLFKSHATCTDDSQLGVKSISWSSDSSTVAICRYDSGIELLSARTFALRAVIKHGTTIDQTDSEVSERQAIVWQESVSSSGERSYVSASQPVSPPVTRLKPSTEPAELGIAEASFSADTHYLASRDERMLSTVWIWDVATLSAHAVILQHSNVRRIYWHPTRSSLLMLDCGEGVAYIFNAATCAAPTPITISLPGTSSLAWLGTVDGKLAIMASTKTSFRVCYLEGRPANVHEVSPTAYDEEIFEEDVSEDSLLDMLSGRKALPSQAPSYTERIYMEAEEAGPDDSVSLDDTFREKHKVLVGHSEVDPLDDSEIF
jgi:WD40 repeat protein